MPRFLSDEDFNNRIVRGLRRRVPSLDLVRAQDVGLMGRHDTEVLAWAAQEGRLVLTHDFATMIDYAYSRLAQGLRLPGVVAISQSLPVGEAIEELIIFIECSLEGEWEGQVVHLPWQ